MKKRRIAIVGVVGTAALAALLCLTGCQSFESSARDAVVSTGAFLNKEVADNTAACQAAPQAQKCVLIKKAAATQNIAVDALEAYCGSSGFQAGTAPCQPPTSATLKQQLADRLKAALLDLNRDVNDVKALTTSESESPAPVNQSRADFTGGGILALIELLLPLLGGLLAKGKSDGWATEIVDAIQAAIDALQKVHGSPVVREQLESARVKVPW